MQSRFFRRAFLDYFEKRGHVLVPSSPLLPHEDPSLLFTNAGMNQFKDCFLGKRKLEPPKATSSQKCVRAGGKHNDLENVGHTKRHLTFFEMLGNFSFGDYFKKQAIDYAWDVSTEIFGFEPERIFPTVFRDDDEAFELWKKYVPEKRITRMDEADNFWSMGETGPCGPCSELYYDRGPKYGVGENPRNDPQGERYLEFWNLVFMEYNRTSEGILEKLPNPSIDTGSGLERVVLLKMGVESVFETDILRSLIRQIEDLSRLSYVPSDDKMAPAFRVIADHLRTLSFAIGDGIIPGNIERGYVLRKILRRAVRYGRMLGFESPFLARLVPSLVELMGEDFPELLKSKDLIEEILTIEEESFFRTLKKGGNLLREVVESSAENKRISGQDAFKLKDTYGLPIDEILLLAKDSELEVDLKSFEDLEKEARTRSKKSHNAAKQEISPSIIDTFSNKEETTVFRGYEEDEIEAVILGIVKESSFKAELNEGEEGSILLDQTPFYSEKGGQVGDQGSIGTSGGLFEVVSTPTSERGLIIHQGKVSRGSLKVGDRVTASLNQSRRRKIEKNHTATHLLHYILCEVLGDRVKQAGSLVEPNRLRFDFSHHKGLTQEELSLVEERVNLFIFANYPVKVSEISYSEAKNDPSIKQFFGEKYGPKVRVVEMGPSKELCGGTHTSATGGIGLFKIVKEGSIASGVRRIEAITESEALEFFQAREMDLEAAGELLKTSPETTVDKLKSLLEEMKALQKQVKDFRSEKLRDLFFSLESIEQKGLRVITTSLPVSAEELKAGAELLMSKQGLDAFFITNEDSPVAPLILWINPQLVQKGHEASALLKQLSSLLGGTGGGRPNQAQGVMRSRDRLKEAFDLFLAKLTG